MKNEIEEITHTEHTPRVNSFYRVIAHAVCFLIPIVLFVLFILAGNYSKLWNIQLS